MDTAPLTGLMLGQYRIEGKLGQGAMGAVFRAWDTQLRRAVAIKLLDPGADRTAQKRARFLHEARAAAALNHPNIVTVFEIGQQGEHDYIAMELVQGSTLHGIIQSGQPVSLPDALKYSIQISDALAAAHTAGVTHRDLKPSNIMVTDHGRLKILDFGIAKRLDLLAETDGTRTLDVLTQHGVAMGTPNYMSPEQAQGKFVDGRSDIYAFGAILFEILTGQRAFPGDSLAEILAAILTKEPPLVSSIRPVPEQLDRLIVRCLRKDVERRFQHADDLKVALEEIWAEVDTTPPPYPSGGWQYGAIPPATPKSGSHYPSAASLPPATPAPPAAPASVPAPVDTRRLNRLHLAAAAIALFAAGAFSSWIYFHEPGPNHLSSAVLRRITADVGLSVWPALSRDGKFIAFASDRNDDKNLQIWVQQLGGGQPIQLTSGPADNTEPAFSPDGTKIAFRSERGGGGIYFTATLGGDARLIARGGRGPRFSPDGSRIAYWVGSDLGKVFISKVDGGAAPQQFQPDFEIARHPAWSPDGRYILFEGFPRPGSASAAVSATRDWWVAPVDGGPATPTRLFGLLYQLNIYPSGQPTWLPGDRLLFAGMQESVGSLWIVPFSPRGNKSISPRRLTFGTTVDVQPAAAPEHSEALRVAFASVSKKIDLWVLPVDANRGRVTGALSRLTEGAGTAATQLTISHDGKRIAFLSDRNGVAQPWLLDLVTGKQTTVNSQTPMWMPAISPDGHTLAWSVFENRIPSRNLRASITADGQLGIAEPLCQNCGPIASWTPDGRGVAFGKSNPSRTAFLELDTGKTYDLLAKPGADVWGGRFSPDGKWLTMNLTPTSARSQIFIAPFNPERRGPVPVSEWIPITDGSTWDDKSRWAPDSKSMYFVSERDGFRCIWWQKLDPATRRPLGAPVPIIHFHETRLSLRNVDMGPLALQVAADKLIFSLGEQTGNIWMFGTGL